MKIDNIITLAEIIHAIAAEQDWQVATQSHPNHWSDPNHAAHSLQWYIDANWLIRVGKLVYDPRNLPQPIKDQPSQRE
jgi:hypothetical protein